MTAGPRGGALACLLATLMLSCGPGARDEAPAGARPAPGAGTLPVTLPELSGLAPALRERLNSQYASLQREVERGSAAPQRGEAFGTMGRLLLAAELVESAEAFFTNAQSLMPDDLRWPYYLGHVSRLTHRSADAVVHFQRALELRPDHEPSLIWIADAYLVEGQPAAAEPYASRATDVQPESAAAWFRRGRAAAAQRQYEQAVRYLERARSLDPKADAIVYQLGLAYRSAGDLQKAAPLLRRPADAASVVPNDPLMDTLPDLVKGSGEFYLVRGLQGMEQRQWAAASADLRTAAELMPQDAGVRVNLGTALFLSGDADGARRATEAAVALDARLPRAHYVLGLILESQRRDAEAIDRFSTAVELDRGYVEALASLGDALRRTGRVEGALARYEQVLALDPAASLVRFGYAMGLVRLARYREAATRLEEGSKLHPDQPGFLHALARLLAAAPDETVRNGPRAVALTEALLKQGQNASVQETMAMALAEVGRFGDAVSWQQRAIATARAADQHATVVHMLENLTGYERRQPCRVPWRADDPVHRPGPQPG